MENANERENLISEEESYVPRPTWQVWAARIGLVLFIIFVMYQVIAVARGGV